MGRLSKGERIGLEDKVSDAETMILWRGPASRLAAASDLLEGWRRRHERAPDASKKNRRLGTALAVTAAVLATIWGSDSARAQSAPSVTWTPAASASTADAPGFFTGIFHRGNLLGDMGGVRPWLGKYGVTFNLNEVSEILGNVSGGTHRGFDYDGLTTMSLGLDTGAAFGWDGGTFNISALQIHGHNLSTDNLSSLQTASGIEADRTTRLWEFWYQQSMFDDKVDVKLGQQSIDQEFIVSSNALLFVNTMLGWPMVPSADLIGGGPAYPLSSPGARLRVKPTDQTAALIGMYDDSPAGRCPTGDPQVCNPSGTNFRLTDSPLVFGELQYSLNQPAEGAIDRGDKPLGLAGTYKLGFWYDAGKFADQEIDNTGVSLANTANTSGVAQQHRGNYSLYGVVDQVVWQDLDSGQALSFFARPMGTPLSDRNVVVFSLNAGLTLKAPLPGRDDDTAGIAFNYAQVGSHASGLNQDSNTFNGTNSPVRSSEQVVEVTYQYQVVPWWILQPDFQYTFNPGAGIPDPNNSNKRVGDEAVVGVRTTITF